MHNHARDVLACDFFVTVTARFHLLLVFMVLDVGTCRLVHWNVTAHPTADWTVHRMCSAARPLTRLLVHDRDCIYSPAVDGALHSMGLQMERP